MRPPLNIVWLKRDLRVRDHAPLLAAGEAGVPFILLYCFEPHVMASPKHSRRHWRFVAQSIADLRARDYQVVVFHGEVEEAFGEIAAEYTIGTIFSHQETGHRLTFLRDQRVRAWCDEHRVDWQEFIQDGVIRGRKHRRGWAEHNDAFLARPQVRSEVLQGAMWGGTDLGLRPFDDQSLDRYLTPTNERMQPGGETAAWRYLRSFTQARGAGYARQLGSPTLSRTSCSRMSTYLAWGCVSVRQVFQWAGAAARQRPDKAHDLRTFRQRLWWRAHFYQKLEAEWQLEGRPLNPVFENLHRTRDPARLNAFREARTGVPMIDANLRCLAATGWINFRSRAMLVTYATFVLWLDFRPVAEHLGSLFLDYDPGIHYGQFQMQAGLTGYHAPRNYNPYKQGERYDPEGKFVHEWLPELQGIPPPFCHYPHRLTALERQLYGLTAEIYPAPIVEFETAARENMDRYWAVRNSAEAQGALMGIWLRHVLPEQRGKYVRGEDVGARGEV